MSYQALARKWRPQFFRDIIGQDTAVRTLQNAIEQERIHHAYLFSGVRGIGKTTTARIFAKAINCVHGPAAEPCNDCAVCREITEGIDLDVREIDAATYTGVDNIRELRDVTQFQPARDRRRVFIIDEAHMLSTGAWNALLKILEEPPPHMLFLFATTEMHKVPATILSRVQTFVLRKITEAEVVARLDQICKAEGIETEPAALEMIARRGEGSVRDSLSLLDQIIAFSGHTVKAADIVSILGLSNATFFSRLLAEISAGNSAAILEALEEAGESGRDFKLLYRDFLAFVRNVMILASGARESMLNLAPEEVEAVKRIATEFDTTEALRILNLLIQDEDVVNHAEQQRLAVEVAILKAAVLPRLRSVEAALRGGAQPAGEPARPRAASASTAAAPRPASPARAPQASGAAGAGSLPTFVERVRAQKKLAGTYLEQARASRVEGDTIVFEFEPEQSFAADYLAETDLLKQMGEIAGEIFGRPMTVRAGVAEAAGGKKEQASPVQADPILSAFAKHLGGEVVAGRKKNN